MEPNGTESCSIGATFRYINLASFVLLTSLCLCGVCGNLLSIYVFSRHHNRSSPLALLLITLSCADCSFLVLAHPITAIIPLSSFLCDTPDWMNQVHMAAFVYLLPLCNISQCLSMWLLMVLTIQQWIAVQYPSYFEKHITRACQVRIVMVCLGAAVLYNVSGFWEMEIDDTTQYPVHLLRSNKLYVWLKLTVGDIAIYYVIPLLVLVTFNSLIYREVSKTRRFHFRMSAKRKSAHRTARMLLFVVLMFIFCYTLALVLLLWELFDADWFLTDWGGTISDLSNLLTVLNAASTFLFYLGFCLRYRHIALRLFKRKTLVSEFSMISSSSLEAQVSELDRRAARRLKDDRILLRQTTTVSWHDVFNTKRSSLYIETNNVDGISVPVLSVTDNSFALTSLSQVENCISEVDSSTSGAIWMTEIPTRPQLENQNHENLCAPEIQNEQDASVVETNQCAPQEVEPCAPCTSLRAQTQTKIRRSLSSSVIGQIRILGPDGHIIKCNEDSDMMVDPEIVTLV